MIKYDWLQEKANDFIESVQKAESQAKNESDFDEICNIVEDMFCGIPNTLCAKDYFMRDIIRNRTDESKQNDTEYINKLMQYIYSQDAIYIGDYAIENIDECIEELEQRGEDDKRN